MAKDNLLTPNINNVNLDDQERIEEQPTLQNLLQEYTSLYKQKEDPELEKLKEKRRQDRMIDALALASDQIMSGVAKGAGGKSERNTAGLDFLRQMTETPIAEYKSEQESKRKKLMDMINVMSKFQATPSSRNYKQIKVFNPTTNKNELRLLDTKSGNIVDPNLAAAQGESAKRYQQTRVFNPKTGQTEVRLFDTATGEVADPGLIAGYSNRFMTDPRTGEIIGLTPSTLSQQPAQITKPTETEVFTDDKGEIRELTGPQKTYQNLNPNQRDKVGKLRNELATETKESREALAKLDGLSEKQIDLAANNPMAWSQLGAQTARLFEGGRLTDEDVVRYTRNKQLAARVAQTLNEWFDGTLTDVNANFLKQSLKVYKNVIQDTLSKRAIEKSKSMANIYPDIEPYNIAPMVYGNFNLPLDIKQSLQFIEANPEHKISEKIKKKLKNDGWL